MRILALDTSLNAGSVALLEDTTILSEERIPPKGTARELVPTIQRLLKGLAWAPRDVQLVAVAVGPGSFTGLRLGLATGKVFAYATQATLVGVDTPRVLAEQVPLEGQFVQVILDAQRGQLFVANLARAADGRWTSEVCESADETCSRPLQGPRRDIQLMDVESWLANITPSRILVGPVLRSLAQRLPSDAQVADSDCWEPRASTVGRLAAGDFRRGRRDDVWALAPVYGRPSAAEEKVRRLLQT